jgi:hypothetical protein
MAGAGATGRAPRIVVPAKDNVNDAQQGCPATEEDVMHPVIAQAVAAERSRENLDHVAAAGRARQLRRVRQARRGRLLLGISRAGQGPAPRPVHRPLRDPRAA